MTTVRRYRFVLVVAAVSLAAACLTSSALKTLDDQGRDFLSKARYIITKPERNLFLAIPAEKRAAFIEEFWKKRDTNPDTEVNEFRDEYFKRITEANFLFSEGGEPGWLQDRGRVYILLGPPTNRITYPRGTTFYDVPREIWYYGFFAILFTDEAWNGNYQIDPLSVEQISVINRAQKEWQPQVSEEKDRIQCRLTAKRTGSGRALVKVAVPYRSIKFEFKGETLRAVLVVTLDLLNLDGTQVQQTRTESTVETTQSKWDESSSDIHAIEIPVEAAAGKYWLRVTVENTFDGSKAYQRIKLSI